MFRSTNLQHLHCVRNIHTSTFSIDQGQGVGASVNPLEIDEIVCDVIFCFMITLHNTYKGVNVWVIHGVSLWLVYKYRSFVLFS